MSIWADKIIFKVHEQSYMDVKYDNFSLSRNLNKLSIKYEPYSHIQGQENSRHSNRTMHLSHP